MSNFYKGWHEGMPVEETKDLAYWERNMLSVLVCMILNAWNNNSGAGWYFHGEWEGWGRVISFYNGQVTFHIPDDFDVGDLPQIEPNWDGHSTEEKWKRLMEVMGMKLDSK